MKRTTWALLCSIGLAGCGVGSNRASEGLALTSVSPVAGLTGTYTKGDVTIRFEAIRGERTDRTDPLTPEWSVDAYFADASGRAFVTSGAADPVSAAAAEGEIDIDRRAAELALVVEAADALSAANVGETGPERDALVTLSNAIRQVPLVRRPSGEVAYSCSTGYLHEFVIRRQPVAVVGQHSSVGLWSYYRKSDCTETNVGYKESCNHGACASGMSTNHCWWSSGVRSYSFPVFQSEPSKSTGTVSGGCSTTYNAVNWSGHHVCNDDSYLQVCNIRANKSYDRAVGPYSTCKDGSLRTGAPSCTASCN